VDTTKKPRNVISFCSGYGGIERGLELAGTKIRTLAHVEIEAYAVANLVAKMETGGLGASPIWSNLKTFPSHLFRDKVEILTGGYPCQPFSNAGQRAGKDDPERHLWPYIREHIAAMRPVRCFFENVEGHITLGLREVIDDLESLGYTTTFGIFSASEVGASHQRKRVYIMADSGSARLQGSERISSNSRQDSKWTESANGSIAECGDDSQQGEWPPEPRVGRVVDGCAERTHRIRLLGNGVVPQTAARAWQVLERQLHD